MVKHIQETYRGAHAAPSQAESIEAEFLRLPAAAKFSGLSRSHIYELVKSGEIKSACIRRRGALRGVRLIHRDSLTAFILKHSASPPSAPESRRPPRHPQPMEETRTRAALAAIEAMNFQPSLTI